jgi:hypothetical protein
MASIDGAGRPRAPSLSRGLSQLNTYTDGAVSPVDATKLPGDNVGAAISTPAQTVGKKGAKGKGAKAKKEKGKASIDDGKDRSSKGLLSDIVTFRWMTVPGTSSFPSSMFRAG